jgi:hypothetical protein
VLFRLSNSQGENRHHLGGAEQLKSLEFKRDFDLPGSDRAPPPVQIAALLAWRARPCNATKAFDDALSQAAAKNRFREPRGEISGADHADFGAPGNHAI